MKAAIRTTCAYCGVGCGIVARPSGERSVDISGDEAHPANRGALCSKGTYLGETVGLEGRLLHPMVGERRVTWDQALDEVATRLRDTIAEHGPDSVAFYVSGQLLTEDYYVANKLMKGFIGSANIDTNSRLCMASAVAAHNRAFGEDVVPCSYDDLDHTDLILLVGSNAAWCHPVVWQRIEKAREHRGTKIVVIDPRRTETAELADLHVPIAPDEDVALFNALLAAMRQRGLVDELYLAAHVDVPEGFWQALPARVDGVPAATFEKLAELVAAHPRMVTVFSQGANQSVCGTDKGNAIINLHLATGRINQRGAGPFSITGQPNAMGGREVGGLATTLACHLGFSDAERAAVGAFWKSPAVAPRPGLTAVDLFRAIEAGEVKFLWVMATNPAVSMPDATQVRRALALCPTVVVSDVMAETDTARFAHIRLPALAWGEREGTVTNSERRVSRQRAFFAPPGEARADWRIVRDVAHRLGFEAAFTYQSPADVFREYAAMTALAGQHGKHLDLTRWAGCSDGEYEAMQPFRWGGAHPLARGFSFANGRARLVSVSPLRCEAGERDYPLTLNTGRYRDQWHTMTRTGLSARLAQHRREPLLEVHPRDASQWGLQDGALAELSTPYGSAVYRVQLTAGQRPGELFVPMHWSDAAGSLGRTGKLARPATDPVSGQPSFKNTPARVLPVTPDWRGFLVTREPVRPAVAWWSRSRIERGWLTELAGLGSVDLTSLLPQGDRSEAMDLRRGMRRIVVCAADGTMLAALFITRSGTLPSREWISAQLGQAGTAPEWLAGRPSAPQPNKGRIVCVCHDVGEQQVMAAIEAGAGNVSEIGVSCRAGTNCGSCRPILVRMLADLQHTLEEAAQ